jgi:hypothetical protein
MAALTNGGRADAQELRGEIYGASREPTRDDVERLIALGRAEGDAPEFADLLAEVALDVFVHNVDPPGYLSDADASWLTRRLSDGGGLACSAEFELLKRLMGHSVSVPESLSSFAVREVERAVLSGRRDGFGSVDHQPGVVTSADVDALRALAFAPTRGHSLHVDRPTAEALFDIAHATASAPNASEFDDFFAKAIGNYLMGVDFLGTPDADEVRETEAELDRPSGLLDFLFAMFHRRPDLRTATEAIGDVQEDEDRRINAETDRRLAAQSHIGDEAGRWVLDHLTRDGELTQAEKRLLAFLRDEAASAPPALAALYPRAA